MQNNERLEFLGDAVLGFIATDWLFRRYPMLREGYLTRLRTALVRTESLAEFALAWGLGAALRLSKSEDESGGRTRTTLLCNAFEAVVGAIYLDQGEAVLRQKLERLFLPKAEALLGAFSTKDAKSRLQEYTQGLEPDLTPDYHVLREIGPLHDSLFVVEARLQGVALGWGQGRTKRAAEQAAAFNALMGLGLAFSDAV